MIVDGNKSTRQPYKTTVYNHGRRIDLANQLDDDVYDDDGGESKNDVIRALFWLSGNIMEASKLGVPGMQILTCVSIF